VKTFTAILCIHSTLTSKADFTFAEEHRKKGKLICQRKRFFCFSWRKITIKIYPISDVSGQYYSVITFNGEIVFLQYNELGLQYRTKQKQRLNNDAHIEIRNKTRPQTHK